MEDDGDAVRLSGRVLAGSGGSAGEPEYRYVGGGEVRVVHHVSVHGDALQMRSGVIGRLQGQAF